MSGMIINLLVQIVAGALGGDAAGAASENFSLGTLGNTVAGAIGGGVGGQVPPRSCQCSPTPVVALILAHSLVRPLVVVWPVQFSRQLLA